MFRVLHLILVLLVIHYTYSQPRIMLHTVREGLSQNSVTAIFQDRTGFIWVGTQDGLNRFDGYMFTKFRHDPSNPRSLSDQYVTAIEEDKEGNLWVGTRNGLNLLNRSTADFTRIYPDPSQKNVIQNPVYKLAALNDGDVLVAISGRIFRRNRKDGTFLPLQENHHITSNISVSGDTVWQAWSPTHACRLLPNRDHRHDDLNVQYQTGWKVSGQAFDGRKFLWSFRGIAPEETAIRLFNIRKEQWNPEVINIPATVSCIAFNAAGDPWIGTDKGIFRRDKKGNFFPWHPEGVPPGSKVLALQIGRDGLVWAGFANIGLGKYNPLDSAFRTIRTGSNDPVFSAHECRDGQLLIASQSGLYLTDLTGTRQSSLLRMKVSAVTEDIDGNYWAGTEGSGVFILNRKGTIIRNLRTTHGLSSNVVFHLSADREGRRVFISTESGLSVATAAGVQEVFNGLELNGIPSRLLGNYVIHSHTDSIGNTWVSSNGGLNVLSRELGDLLSVHSGSDTCRFIRRTIVTGTATGKNGVQWISTLSGGVYRRENGRFRNFRTDEGLSSNVAYGVVTDATGRAWVATSRGISIIEDNSGRIIRLTEEDGLSATDYPLASVSKGNSGTIYIGSQQGLIVANPGLLQERTFKPVVYLESAQVNYESVPLNDAFRLEPSGNAVTFRFAAPVFINASQVLYQYRMEGLVDKWVSLDADNRVVSFTSLPYKALRLELRAAMDPAAIENSPVTSIFIERSPPLWRNPWFYFPVSLLAMGTVAMQIRGRIRRKLEETERRAELDRSLAAERERLSRDLHDRLGAYAAAIKSNITQLERSEVTDHAPLDRLKKNAEEMVTALRETIWALKQKQVSLTGISDRLKSHVNRIAPDFPLVSLQVRELPGLDHSVTPASAIHLMAIIQEAITNALRHSGCTRVEIMFLGGRGFKVSIADNGRGFNSNPHSAGYGLQNMRQRAAESGFLFDISSTESGTTVTVGQLNALS